MEICLFFLILFFLLSVSFEYTRNRLITTLELVEVDEFSSYDVPVTFGLPFAEGEVLEGIKVTYNDNFNVPYQFDIKKLWNDDFSSQNSSVRFGIISVILPKLRKLSVNTLKIYTAEKNNEKGYVSLKRVKENDNIESVIELTHLSGTQHHGKKSASFQKILGKYYEEELLYWLKGPVVTEIVLKTNISSSLSLVWEARVYPSIGKIRFSNTVENVQTHPRGRVTYDARIFLGRDRKEHYYKGSCNHIRNTRWRKVLWVGGQSRKANPYVKYDPEYLMHTGQFFNYDVNLTVPEDHLKEVYTKFTRKEHQVLEWGVIPVNFEMASLGSREDIAPFPAWTVRWLLSMDYRMYSIMINAGTLSASVPIHYREHQGNKLFYRMPISIEDRPTVQLGLNNADYSPLSKPEDAIPQCVGDCDSYPWKPDLQHQGSYCYVPYMVTGDYFFLEELHFWASYNLAAMDITARNMSDGIINNPNQPDADAWVMRNLVHAAAATPAELYQELGYYERKITETLWYWENVKRHEYPLKYWSSFDSSTLSLPQINEAAVGQVTHPYANDFLLMILPHIRDLGYDTTGIISWFSEFIINRLNPIPPAVDFNPYNGCDYVLPVADSLNAPFTTWAEVKGFIVNTAKTEFEYFNEANRFEQMALAALTAICDEWYIPGIYEVFLDTFPEKSDVGEIELAKNPIFAFRPVSWNGYIPPNETRVGHYVPPPPPKDYTALIASLSTVFGILFACVVGVVVGAVVVVVLLRRKKKIEEIQQEENYTFKGNKYMDHDKGRNKRKAAEERQRKMQELRKKYYKKDKKYFKKKRQFYLKRKKKMAKERAKFQKQAKKEEAMKRKSEAKLRKSGKL